MDPADMALGLNLKPPIKSEKAHPNKSGRRHKSGCPGEYNPNKALLLTQSSWKWYLHGVLSSLDYVLVICLILIYQCPPNLCLGWLEKAAMWMVDHRNPKIPNQGLAPDGTPCIYFREISRQFSIWFQLLKLSRFCQLECWGMPDLPWNCKAGSQDELRT